MKKIGIQILIVVTMIVWIFPASSTFAEVSELNDNKNPKFEQKSLNDRKKLSKNEQKVVNEIQAYLSKRVNLKQRSSLPEDMYNNALIGLVYELAFNGDNTLTTSMMDIYSNLISGNNPSSEWFDGLTNKSDLYTTVFDDPTNSNIKLHARYIDNKSNKTVFVVHGYRMKWTELLGQIEFFSKQGYNVLIPDLRSHGESEGKFITLGAYEKNDVNTWINLELENRPDQEIILYGTSMGAATVMLSQESPNTHVKAIIEDSGYATTEDELRGMVRLMIPYLQYIPFVNTIDWYGKESQWLQVLNENYIKPQLKFDLFTNSPLNSVSKSSLPKLFIHGDADWVVNQQSQEKLFDRSLGYKEKLTVKGAGHVASFLVDHETFEKTVISFLDTVEQKYLPKPEVIAEDVNLLNPSFETVENKFTNWETSTDDVNFSNKSLIKNSYNEFVLRKNGNEDTVTIKPSNNGFRLFTRYLNTHGYVGQDVNLVAGQEYQLSFNVNNAHKYGYTTPNVLYGIGKVIKDEGQVSGEQTLKSFIYKPISNEKVKVKLGSKVGYYSWVSDNYTQVAFSDVKLINADHTAPYMVKLNGIIKQDVEQNSVIRGKGEPNSEILLQTNDDRLISSTKTDSEGSFEVIVPSSEYNSILHLTNKDFKGNVSKSKVLFLN